jgi:hypothetical protein
MKSHLVVVLLCVSILWGCSATARLYPVQGPLSSQTPPPVYVAKMTGAFTSGDFSATLNGSEKCTGRWSQVSRPKASVDTAAAASSLSAENMSAEWDTVYGQGFYVAHVLGARLYAKAVLTGNKGTILNVELYKPDVPDHNNIPTATIRGVAKDNHDNVYKVAF